MRLLVWTGLAVLAVDIVLVAWMAARAVCDTRIRRRRRRLEDLGVVPLPSTVAMRNPHVGKTLVGAAIAAVVVLGVARVPPAPAEVAAASRTAPPASTASGFPSDIDPAAGGGRDVTPQPVPTTAPAATGSAPAPSAAAPAVASAEASDANGPSTVAAVSTSTTTIRLEWASVPDATSYGVERSIELASWTSVGTTDGSDTSYVDASVAAGTTYYYRVVAFVLGEDPVASDAVSATTPDELPVAPAIVSVTPSASSVDISWTNVDGELGYRIERSPDGATGWVGIGTTGQDITSFTDAGLTPATAYSYRVIAIGAVGESPPSAVSTVTTAADDTTT